MRSSSPELTVDVPPPPARAARGRSRFAAALATAATLHAGLAFAWLVSPATPFGGDGQRADAVTVTLVDGAALDSVKSAMASEPPGAEASLAATLGDAMDTVAAAAVRETMPVVEPAAQPVADLAPIIAAELPVPPLPTEAASIEPSAVSQAPSVTGGAQSRSAAAIIPREAAAGATPGVIDAYKAKLVAALGKTQPPNRGTSGTVLVAFTVAVDGALDATSVARTSGHAALDQLALAAVRRARLPTPDAAMTVTQRTFSMRYVFR